MPEGDEEPTTECPNCGALVPVGAPRCFICDEAMPEIVKVEAEPPKPSPPEIPPAEKVEGPQPIREAAVIPAEEPTIEKPPEEVHAQIEEVTEAAPVAPTPAEEKAAKLKEAWEAGKIPREVYVGNLKALGFDIPPELEEAPEEVAVPAETKLEAATEIPLAAEKPMEVPPEETHPTALINIEEKAARLRSAYEAGTIPKEVYVENLRTLGVPVPPEFEERPAEVKPEIAVEVPPVAEAVEAQPQEVPPPEIIVEREKAEETGGPSREKAPSEVQPEVHVGIPAIKEEIVQPAVEEKPTEEHAPEAPISPEKPPESEKAEPAAIIQAEIAPMKEEVAPPKEEKTAEVAPAEEAKAAIPTKPSNIGKKAARLKKAYKTGRITKEVYIDSLKALGLPLPQELEQPPAKPEEPIAAVPEMPTEILPKVETAPSIPEEVAPAKVAPAEEEAPAEIKPPEPSPNEVRAAKLRSLYETGTIPKEVYVGNLRMLGLPIPPELEGQEEEAIPEAVSVETIPVAEEAAAEAVPEEIPQVEEEIAAEVPEVIEEAVPEVVEEAEAPAAAEVVAKGEIEGPPRSYRGVAIASAGGLIYVLVWLLFVQMLGNFLSFVFTALGAILLVVGYNVASKDAAAARRARTFKCPLCSERLEIYVSECPNCGAKFSD